MAGILYIYIYIYIYISRYRLYEPHTFKEPITDLQLLRNTYRQIIWNVWMSLSFWNYSHVLKRCLFSLCWVLMCQVQYLRMIDSRNNPISRTPVRNNISANVTEDVSHFLFLGLVLNMNRRETFCKCDITLLCYDELPLGGWQLHNLEIGGMWHLICWWDWRPTCGPWHNSIRGLLGNKKRVHNPNLNPNLIQCILSV